MSRKGKIQQLAEAAGVNQASVRRAIIDAGRDPKAISFDDALPIVRAVVDTDRVIGHAASGRGEGGNNESSVYTAAKAEHARQQTEKIRIQNERALGKLIDRDAVTETGKHIIATARTAFLSLSYRLAEKVAGKTDLAHITGIIESEVRIVLGELADESRFMAALDAGTLE
jgi:hypothetical protein